MSARRPAGGPPTLPGMELAARYVPGQPQVGNDLYDVFRVGTNDWGLVIGDVCGKGPEGVSLNALTRSTLRAAAAHTYLPSSVLHEVNEALVAEGAQADDHWCSAVFSRIELDECGAWVTVASAGHPRPVVVRRAGWIDVRGHVGTPLGLFRDPVLADDRVGLGPGDALVLFTDGISGALDATGELFGDEALPELLLDGCGTAAEHLADHIVDAARSFAGGHLRDDAAVLVLRVPDDADEAPLARLTSATGVALPDLPLPGYPVGDVHTELWGQRPAPPREARTRLPPDTSALVGLRELLRRLLGSWRMEELAGGDLELVATELAANAMTHAGTPAVVIVRYLGPVIRLEVGDGSPELVAPRRAPPNAAGGRGLTIVAALSSDWGTVATRDGKRVWCELPAVAARS